MAGTYRVRLTRRVVQWRNLIVVLGGDHNPDDLDPDVLERIGEFNDDGYDEESADDWALDDATEL